jgi:hypothetical protein
MLENDFNRREFTRVPVSLEAELVPENYLPFSAQVTNASLKGLYVCCDSPLPIGTPCSVELLLGGRQAPVRIGAKSTVARSDPAGMGLEITSLVGTENFDHLRNLVLCNAPDTGRVLKEFQSHVGLRRWEQEASPDQH